MPHRARTQHRLLHRGTKTVRSRRAWAPSLRYTRLSLKLTGNRIRQSVVGENISSAEARSPDRLLNYAILTRQLALFSATQRLQRILPFFQ